MYGYYGNDIKSVSGDWDNVYTTVNTNSADWLLRTGDEMTGNLTVHADISGTNSIYISSVRFTGFTSIATSMTASDTFIRVDIDGVTKYVRLFDIE